METPKPHKKQLLPEMVLRTISCSLPCSFFHFSASVLSLPNLDRNQLKRESDCYSLWGAVLLPYGEQKEQEMNLCLSRAQVLKRREHYKVIRNGPPNK